MLEAGQWFMNFDECDDLEWEWHQEALADCFLHSGGSSWWEFDDGCHLYYW
jgi:hypothetical protein